VRIQKTFYKVCPEPQTGVNCILESSLPEVGPGSNYGLKGPMNLEETILNVPALSLQIVNPFGDTITTGDNYILDYFSLDHY